MAHQRFIHFPYGGANYPVLAADESEVIGLVRALVHEPTDHSGAGSPQETRLAELLHIPNDGRQRQVFDHILHGGTSFPGPELKVAVKRVRGAQAITVISSMADANGGTPVTVCTIDDYAF